MPTDARQAVHSRAGSLGSADGRLAVPSQGAHRLFARALRRRHRLPHDACGSQLHTRGYRIVPFSDRRGLRRYGSFFDVVRLYRALARERPDIILQFVGSAHTGIAALYARSHGCKMIWRVTSDRSVEPETASWLLAAPASRAAVPELRHSQRDADPRANRVPARSAGRGVSARAGASAAELPPDGARLRPQRRRREAGRLDRQLEAAEESRRVRAPGAPVRAPHRRPLRDDRRHDGRGRLGRSSSSRRSRRRRTSSTAAR